MRHARVVWWLLAAALAVGWWDGAPPFAVRAGAAGAAQGGRTSVAIDGYDLAGDEAIGGHTLERHVGRSDAELAERLRREPQISAVSTYPDQATAARVVALALEANRGRVSAWASRGGPRPNLVVTYDSRAGPIGRSLRRGQRTADACRRARVVLRWHDRRGRWYVLTSYPEAGR